MSQSQRGAGGRCLCLVAQPRPISTTLMGRHHGDLHSCLAPALLSALVISMVAVQNTHAHAIKSNGIPQAQYRRVNAGCAAREQADGFLPPRRFGGRVFLISLRGLPSRLVSSSFILAQVNTRTEALFTKPQIITQTGDDDGTSYITYELGACRLPLQITTALFIV